MANEVFLFFIAHCLSDSNWHFVYFMEEKSYIYERLHKKFSLIVGSNK